MAVNSRGRDPGVIINQIIDTMQEILIGLADYGELTKHISDQGMFATNICLRLILIIQGAEVLDLLEWALESIGVHNIRTKSGKDLTAELKEFVEISSSFDLESNEAALKPYIQMLKRHISLLEESLQQDWNTKLGMENEPNEIITHQGDWLFYKASPLKEQKKTYLCEGEGCDKTYSNHKYYQAHLKKVHDIIKKIEPPRVTCRLEHPKATKPIAFDQIGSHLKRVHGITKENEGDDFRGFLSTDGGATHRPIWLPADAADPEPPVVEANVQHGEDREQAGPVIVEEADPEVRVESETITGDADVATDLQEESGGLSGGGEENQNVDTDVPITDIEEASSTAANLSSLEEPDKVSCKKLEILEPEPNKKNEASSTLLSYDVQDIFCEDSLFDKLQSETLPKASSPVPAPESAFENVLQGDSFNLMEDSDIEDDDLSSFTQKRLKNKEARYLKRNQSLKKNVKPHETEDNQSFIEEFNRYLTKKSLNDTETSHNDKATGHLFSYEDSLLNYMLKSNPDFKLADLVAFKSSRLVELTDPVNGWTDSISGNSGNENPSRRREQLKYHANIRDFVLMKLNTTDFGTKLKDLMRKDKLKSNLEQLNRDVKESRIWAKTKSLIHQNKQKTDNAKLLVNPAQNANEAVSVSVYLSSKEFRSREEKMKKIWEKYENGENIGTKEFNDLANFVRHVLGKIHLLLSNTKIIVNIFSFY